MASRLLGGVRRAKRVGTPEGGFGGSGGEYEGGSGLVPDPFSFARPPADPVRISLRAAAARASPGPASPARRSELSTDPGCPQGGRDGPTGCPSQAVPSEQITTRSPSEPGGR